MHAQVHYRNIMLAREIGHAFVLAYDIDVTHLDDIVMVYCESVLPLRVHDPHMFELAVSQYAQAIRCCNQRAKSTPQMIDSLSNISIIFKFYGILPFCFCTLKSFSYIFYAKQIRPRGVSGGVNLVHFMLPCFAKAVNFIPLFLFRPLCATEVLMFVRTAPSSQVLFQTTPD